MLLLSSIYQTTMQRVLSTGTCHCHNSYGSLYYFSPSHSEITRLIKANPTINPSPYYVCFAEVRKHSVSYKILINILTFQTHKRVHLYLGVQTARSEVADLTLYARSVQNFISYLAENKQHVHCKAL